MSNQTEAKLGNYIPDNHTKTPTYKNRRNLDAEYSKYRLKGKPILALIMLNVAKGSGVKAASIMRIPPYFR
jgi:hypothetical protein